MFGLARNSFEYIIVAYVFRIKNIRKNRPSKRKRGCNNEKVRIGVISEGLSGSLAFNWHIHQRIRTQHTRKWTLRPSIHTVQVPALITASGFNKFLQDVAILGECIAKGIRVNHALEAL